VNLYSYAGNNPISFDDPYGLCPWCIGAALGAAVAGTVQVAANIAQGQPLDHNLGQSLLVGAVVGGSFGLAAPEATAAFGARLAIGGATAATAGATGRVMLEGAKQGKHIPGHNNFIQGRSLFTHGNAQGLLDKFAGTGQRVSGVAGQPGFKERVNFGQVIGQVNVNGVMTETANGIIHYSKNGAHIVPAAP